MKFNSKADRTLQDILTYIKGLDIIENKDNRILVIDEIKPNFWGGCLLSIRSDRVLLKFKFEDGVYQIKPEELEKGTNKIDVNFFLINTNTNRGLFQTYHRSASFNIFFSIIKRHFLTMRSIQKFKGNLTANELLRNESIDEWLEKVDRIKKIQLDFSVSGISDSTLKIMSAEASTSRLTLTYRKTLLSKLGELKRATKNLLQKEQDSFEKFIIKGQVDGQDEFFDVFENIDVFYYQDFDEYAKSLQIESSDLVKSILSSNNLKELIRIYETPHIKRHIG